MSEMTCDLLQLRATRRKRVLHQVPTLIMHACACYPTRSITSFLAAVSRPSATTATAAHMATVAAASARYHGHSLLELNVRQHELHISLQEAVAFCRQHPGVRAPASPTPYTGTAGLAFALWRAGRLTQQQQLVSEGQRLAAEALQQAQARRGHYVEESLLDGRCAACRHACQPGET